LATANQAALANRTSCTASSGVSPQAEQNFRSGISAIQQTSFALQKTLMW